MLFASLLLACIATATASQVYLPQPSGVYQVGRSVMELIDSSRTQPFAPKKEPRKLMISVFYPVRGNEPTTAGAYMPSLTARFEDEYYSSLGAPLPNGTMEEVYLHLAGNKSAPNPDNFKPCSHPLVFFMPAEGTTRLYYNLIASTVSSNGYTVVTIDTPYDVDIVEYSDGSVVFLDPAWNTQNITLLNVTANVAVQTRAQDVSFVLDSLSNTTLAHSLVPNLPVSGLNTTHATMFGHSLGGATALTVTVSEPRIMGGLNMDSAFIGDAINIGTDKPVMIMAHANNTRTNTDDPTMSWERTWPNLKGWKRDINIANSGHYDFSDVPVVFETLGVKPSQKADANSLYLGSIKGTRALQIVTTYVTAFLDFVVYGKCSALLDGPVAAFPEVTFDY